MKQVIGVALSGGIDSLVAACLLKKQGHRVFGIHFKTGYEPGPDTDQNSGRTDMNNDIISATADQLEIPLHIVDLSIPFKTEVINYFIQSYQAGKTPNPCLVCNPRIKFDLLFKKAQNLGADLLATGHYAIIKKDDNGICHLFKGADPLKDQSYFLARLTKKQLAKACFPLGNWKKKDVIAFAKENNLKPVTTAESQDICFIKKNSYADFLTNQPGFQAKPGLIENIQGQIIGEHSGLHLFTIGQRRGINCPAPAPYYVIRLDQEKKRLIVGEKKDLLASECIVQDINWINKIPVAAYNRSKYKLTTKLRYRHKGTKSLIQLLDSDNNIIQVKFDQPQSAITPGQGAVFYDGSEILGGGWIEAI